MFDYGLLICTKAAEIFFDEELPEKVRDLRLKAFGKLYAQLEGYKKLGYIDRLVNGIAEKRIAMIMKATTKTEMDSVMTPKAPHYNGAHFIPDEYNIPEEEMIVWSQISLKGPLIEAGYKRYAELFTEFFPEENKKFSIVGRD